jgi:hypothetical protein
MDKFLENMADLAIATILTILLAGLSVVVMAKSSYGGNLIIEIFGGIIATCFGVLSLYVAVSSIRNVLR